MLVHQPSCLMCLCLSSLVANLLRSWRARGCHVRSSRQFRPGQPVPLQLGREGGGTLRTLRALNNKGAVAAIKTTRAAAAL